MGLYLQISTMHHACSVGCREHQPKALELHVWHKILDLQPQRANSSGSTQKFCQDSLFHCMNRRVWKRPSLKQHESFCIAPSGLKQHFSSAPLCPILPSQIEPCTSFPPLSHPQFPQASFSLAWKALITDYRWHRALEINEIIWNQYESKLHPDK